MSHKRLLIKTAIMAVGERSQYYVSEKNTSGYPLSIGIWADDIWRQMEIKNYLRTGRKKAAPELIEDGVILRRQFDEIPPRVEYCLTEKGVSVVPILQSICQWSGMYHNESSDLSLPQCRKCNYSGEKINEPG